MNGIDDIGTSTGRQEYIFEILTKIITEFAREPAFVCVTPSSDLRKEVGIDSASLVDVWLEVETRFEISIDDSEMDNVQTIDDFVTLVAKRWNGAVRA